MNVCARVFQRLRHAAKKGPGEPHEPYAQIKTDFVRRRLRQTSWRERRMIDELMRIEAALAKGIASAAHARSIDILRRRHPAAYEAICLELQRATPIAPPEYEALERRLKIEANEAKRRQQALAAIERLKQQHGLEQLRSDWLKQGGQA